MIRSSLPVPRLGWRALGLAAAVAVAAVIVPSATAEAATPPAAKACSSSKAVRVSTADGLTRALASASPGTMIILASGTYRGNFVLRAAGSSTKSIVLCGPRSAVIDPGGIDRGYAIHLNGAKYWQVSGFTIRSGMKGLMADNAQANRVEGLLVEGSGDEAVHLRRHSSDNIVRSNTIRNTGLRTPAIGEGIYVGSAQSNWCELTGCSADRSDRNVVELNEISATTAESVDIKEGTTSGILRNNRFDAVGMTDADSWVDVKGNKWTISGNIGNNGTTVAGLPVPSLANGLALTSSLVDGFQLHKALDGWGLDNVFSANTANVNASGYGFNITTNKDRNRVSCNNRVSGASKGYANVSCR